MKQITTLLVGLCLLVPSIASAQSISTFELNQLLQQDTRELVLLNGEDAVRQYFINLLLLIAQQSGISIDSNNNSSSDDAEVETLSAVDVEDDEAELRGEVQEGDNVRVWFAISRTDTTPSCSSSSQRESVSGRYDEGDDFDEVVTNLRDDTRYYYRACAQDDDRDITSGDIRRFTTDDENDEDAPEVETEDVDDIERTTAELNGSVDMNDFKNGIVFFVWGEDEDQVEDVEDEDEYDDVDEDGDDLQKQRVDSDLDGEDDYKLDIRNLDRNTDHYYTICVEYEDEDDDETLECGSVEEFETDN